MYFRPPGFLKRMMPSLIWNMESADSVFLTFDDGPNPDTTLWILECLARYGARATFFCLGKNVELRPELFRAIVDGGHAVGNHTYSHQKGWEMSTGRYLEDVDFAASFIRSNLFRPPYGRIKPSQARRLSEHYNIIMWDVLSRDYSRFVSPRACLRNVVNHVRPGSIVAFHDSRKSFRNIRYALPRTLEHIQKMGLRCQAIEL